jgi:hypothetical protein
LIPSPDIFIRIGKKATASARFPSGKNAKTADLSGISHSARCVLNVWWLRVVVVNLGGEPGWRRDFVGT